MQHLSTINQCDSEIKTATGFPVHDVHIQSGPKNKVSYCQL